jgi:hypothetical protein
MFSLQFVQRLAHRRQRPAPIGQRVHARWLRAEHEHTVQVEPVDIERLA